jgi:DNA-binding NarL/FixJ family response regulator
MSSVMESIRILTVDDHPLIRQGIVGLVTTQSDMRVIGEATNGRQGIQQFRTHRKSVSAGISFAR